MTCQSCTVGAAQTEQPVTWGRPKATKSLVPTEGRVYRGKCVSTRECCTTVKREQRNLTDTEGEVCDSPLT